jgi:preprotein translocase subunit SecF
MIQLIPTDLNIDFLKLSKPVTLVSTLAVIASAIAVFTVGLNLGIDFTGGAEVTVKVPPAMTITEVRASLEAGGISDPVVVQLGSPEDHEFLVKIQATQEEMGSVSEKVDKAFAASTKGGEAVTIRKVDVVGPQAGERLKTSAILSILYAALGILCYITLRFDVRFAPGILRALLLDVVLVLGVWILLGKEFNLMVVAALLTIAGYSCNDTIVIYDRIREYSKTHPQWTLEQVINRAINLNLGRTILTVLCTSFVVVSLWLLGGPVLADFAFALLVGFTISIFSTIFVANSMVLYMEKRRLAKEAAEVHSRTARA